MSSTPPNRDNGYAIPVDARATRELFQEVFSDIHERLLPVEAKEADYDAAINLIVTQALATVSATLGEEVASQRAVLDQLQAQAEEILDEYQSRNIEASRVLLSDIPDLVATSAQAAIAELMGTKASLAGSLFSGLVTFFSGTAERAGVNVGQRGSAPTSPANGDIWSLATGLWGYFGGVARQFYDTTTLPAPTNAEIDAGTNTLRKAWSVLDVWRAARAALPLFTQAQAEAGNVATAGSWSPQRDAQAIAVLAPKGSTTAGTLGSTTVGTAGVFLASADFVATGPSCRGLINCSVEGSADALFSTRLDLILVSNGSLVRQGSGTTILHKANGLERNFAEVEFTGLTRGAAYRLRGFGSTAAGSITVTSIVTGQCS